MITTLHIKNIGIIDDIVIDLNKGLNVLTGETGAGKTLIVDSLGIIAGGRFSKDMIRRGQNMSFVELALYLPDNPNSIDGNIVVSREINTSGKNLCKINGRLVTVNELKNFMKNIIDIHGQYDNQTLMDTEFHTKYLDKFIGTRIAEIHKKYVELYTEYIELNKMLKNNYGDEIEKQRKLDLLQYQYKEIKAANLKNGEDEQLEEKRKIIMSSEKVAEALNIVSNNLEGNIIDVVNDSIRALEKIEDVNSKYSEKLVEMKNIYYEVQEVARDISSMKEDIYFDERERNEIEERLDEIYSLKKKYGNTIEKILDYKEELEKENEKLKKENAELREQLVDYLDTKEENAKLWIYYELKKENPSYDILPAGVLRRDANDDFYSFTLDKGSTDNVEKNDPVITENGLIGWVSDVELTTCRVRTILSPDTKASAIDKKTSDNGIISGNAEYCDDNLTCLTKIAENNKIKVGDIVVTSVTGGVYPKNLIIGKVKELKFNSYDTTRYAVVEPYEDIRTVTSAAIITDFDGKVEVKK